MGSRRGLRRHVEHLTGVMSPVASAGLVVARCVAAAVSPVASIEGELAAGAVHQKRVPLSSTQTMPARSAAASLAASPFTPLRRSAACSAARAAPRGAVSAALSAIVSQWVYCIRVVLFSTIVYPYPGTGTWYRTDCMTSQNGGIYTYPGPVHYGRMDARHTTGAGEHGSRALRSRVCFKVHAPQR